MPEKYFQRIATEDHCLYLFDYDKNKWQKLCDVDSSDIPDSVKQAVKEKIEEGQTEITLLKTIKF